MRRFHFSWSRADVTAFSICLILLLGSLFSTAAFAKPEPKDDKGDNREGEEELFVPDDEVVSKSGLSIATGEPPPGYESVEVIDRSIGFRDETLASVSVDDDGVLWVTTWQGRIYKSDDDGENWNEYVVLPEVKEIFGFASQYVLLGHLRRSGAHWAKTTNLAPSGESGANRAAYRLLSDNPSRAAQVDISSSSLLTTPNLSLSGSYYNPLRSASRRATGESDIVLGAGLSNRAPRLSLLLSILKRPTANISMQRLLYTTAGRYTTVREITQHPTDKNKVFAATAFGLYKSDDSGVSWYRDFAGMTPAERWIGHVAVDPQNPKRIYMGTSRGLFMSDDSGESWYKNTKVPEISIRRVAIDPTDSRYVYAAGWGGMYRSNDYGENFNFAFYHSIPRRRDVLWMAIDPFDPNIGYLGTSDGLMRTSNLRNANVSDWEVVDGLRTVNLVIGTVELCTKHPGHIYAQTRADLPVINYKANGPESLIMESWDHGKSWTELAGNRTQGDVRWFTLDPKDPDTLWVVFSRALVKIKHQAAEEEKDLSSLKLTMGTPVLPDMPSMGDVLKSALLYNELELDEFVKRLDKLRHRHWIPSKINMTMNMGKWNVGGDLEDIQFDDTRYYNLQTHTNWNLSMWASWNLPDILYRLDSAPLMQFREFKMIESVRSRILRTIHRNYGELQRIRLEQRHGKAKSLRTRVNWHIRAQYLEAIINLATGDFLSKWIEEANQ